MSWNEQNSCARDRPSSIQMNLGFDGLTGEQLIWVPLIGVEAYQYG